jgi:hypothetical protein
MQRRSQLVAIGTALAALAACAGQQVTTDYSPKASFSHYRTFALVSRPDSVTHQLVDDRVRTAVAAQLTAKGLTETSRDDADLFVGYGIVDRTHKEVLETGWPWGPVWGWRYYRWGVAWPVDIQRDIETYTDGTVVVTMIDAKTHQVVWQGEAADVLPLPVRNPKKATQEIDVGVKKLLAKFPPASAA